MKKTTRKKPKILLGESVEKQKNKKKGQKSRRREDEKPGMATRLLVPEGNKQRKTPGVAAHTKREYQGGVEAADAKRHKATQRTDRGNSPKLWVHRSGNWATLAKRHRAAQVTRGTMHDEKHTETHAKSDEPRNSPRKQSGTANGRSEDTNTQSKLSRQTKSIVGHRRLGHQQQRQSVTQANGVHVLEHVSSDGRSSRLLGRQV